MRSLRQIENPNESKLSNKATKFVKRSELSIKLHLHVRAMPMLNPRSGLTSTMDEFRNIKGKRVTLPNLFISLFVTHESRM